MQRNLKEQWTAYLYRFVTAKIPNITFSELKNNSRRYVLISALDY